ncbi:MAG: glucokinase, partial [Nanoarchaeota archaeon]|nr:glucokinase [Nanoarchaeota archaeon]
NVLASEINSTEALFDEFHARLKQHDLPRPDIAVLACAGPISSDGRSCQLTNVDMHVSAPDLAKKGIATILINDFFANASAIPHLYGNDVTELDHGQKLRHTKPDQLVLHNTTAAIVGPGTGLGVAGIYYDGKRYIPVPSEAGHLIWRPVTEFEKYLDDFLMEHVTDGRIPTMESVTSGVGLANIIAFMDKGKMPQKGQGEQISDMRKKSAWKIFMDRVYSTEPQLAGREVIKAYDEHTFKPVIGYAVDIFTNGLAVAVRQAANAFAAYDGGVFISGGNARRLQDHLLGSTEFKRVVNDSYTHQDKIASMPIYLATSNTLGTYGAAMHGFQAKH